MSFASLAAKYRPQTFADVVGQDLIKGILSRTAAERRVAPAYMLSGTRGVGKTTIARIFAKALNCVNGPAAEPCNECPACRSVTQGSFVDVVEIDGASNRGIDDVRRLRDSVGYAPMEGAYKVFIIDEAHMLSRDAFNALLKTLEEPPPRATFILATTEPHKFPITVISRCQHFVFKEIPEAQLIAHLSNVLNNEGIAFEEEALHLLSRRAEGSVRDSMSLLGQVLALGGDSLSEKAVRNVLGMAGREFYERLLYAAARGDCLAVSRLTGELLTSGADIGFFLTELSGMWRALFLLKQAGREALPLIDLPEAEKERLISVAGAFSITAVHAAWQITLDGQKQVINSIDPGSALELLLLNLALTPRLASLELLSSAVNASASAASPSLSKAGQPPSGESVPPSPAPLAHLGLAAASGVEPPAAFVSEHAPFVSSITPARPIVTSEFAMPQVHAAASDSAISPNPEAESLSSVKSAYRLRPLSAPSHCMPVQQTQLRPENSLDVPAQAVLDTPPWEVDSVSSSASVPGRLAVAVFDSSVLPPEKSTHVAHSAEYSENTRVLPSKTAALSESFPHELNDPQTRANEQQCCSSENWPYSWEKFIEFCELRMTPDMPLQTSLLRQTSGRCDADTVTLTPASVTLHGLLNVSERVACLKKLAAECAGREIEVIVLAADRAEQTEGELKELMSAHPAVRLMEEHFDAAMMRCRLNSTEFVSTAKKRKKRRRIIFGQS